MSFWQIWSDNITFSVWSSVLEMAIIVSCIWIRADNSFWILSIFFLSSETCSRIINNTNLNCTSYELLSQVRAKSWPSNVVNFYIQLFSAPLPEFPGRSVVCPFSVKSCFILSNSLKSAGREVSPTTCLPSFLHRTSKAFFWSRPTQLKSIHSKHFIDYWNKTAFISNLLEISNVNDFCWVCCIQVGDIKLEVVFLVSISVS